MKRLLAALVLTAVLALAFVTPGCKTSTLEPGGAYSPTNAVGEVVHNDIGLAMSDASYKFAYESALTVFQFEKDNRAALWAVSPEIKHTLDKARPVVVDINVRWAVARRSYRQNPTPASADALTAIVSEMQRLLPAVQSAITVTNKIR